MKEDAEIKTALYNACVSNVEDRIKTILATLESIKEARNNETKSSAGDKYETSRAMMQIEEDNSKGQLVRTQAIKRTLFNIDVSKKTDKVELGSLVKTNKGIYFISIGLGKMELNGKIYFCISVDAPIGKVLLNKKVGETIVFNGNTIEIEKIL